MRKYLHYSVVLSIAVFIWLVILAGSLGFVSFFMKSGALEDIFTLARRHGLDDGPLELESVHRQEPAHEPQMKRDGSKLLLKFPYNPMSPQAPRPTTTISYVTNTFPTLSLPTPAICADCSGTSLAALASTPNVDSEVSHIVVVNGATAPLADGVDSGSGNSPDSFFSVLAPALPSIPPPKTVTVTLISTTALLTTTTTTCSVTQTWHSTCWSTTTETWYSTCFEFTTTQISFVAAMTVTVTASPCHECRASSTVCSKCQPTITSCPACMESSTPCDKCMPTPTMAPQHMEGCSCKICNSIPQMNIITVTKDMQPPITRDVIPATGILPFLSTTDMSSISAATSTSVSTSSSAGTLSPTEVSSSVVTSNLSAVSISAAAPTSERVPISESALNSAAAPSSEGTLSSEATLTSAAATSSAAASTSVLASNSAKNSNSAALSSLAIASSPEAFFTLPTVLPMTLPSSLPTTLPTNPLHGVPSLRLSRSNSVPVAPTATESIITVLNSIVPSLTGLLSSAISVPSSSMTSIPEVLSKPLTSISDEIICATGMVPKLDVSGSFHCIVQPGISKALNDVNSSVGNVLPSAVASKVSCVVGTLPKVDIHGIISCVVPAVVSGVGGDVSSLIGVTPALNEALPITRATSPAIANIVSSITPTLASVVVPSLSSVALSILGSVLAETQSVNGILGDLPLNQAFSSAPSTIATATRAVGSFVDKHQPTKSGLPPITDPFGGIGGAEAVETITSQTPVDKATDIITVGPQNPTVMTSVDGDVTHIIQVVEVTSTSSLPISSLLRRLPIAASMGQITALPAPIPTPMGYSVIAPIKHDTTLVKRVVQVTSTVTVIIPRHEVSSSIITTKTLLRSPFQ